MHWRTTLGKSSNRSPENFVILANLSNILKVAEFQTKEFDLWSNYSNYHFN